MNREEFMKAKQEEIKQEVDFLREEKAEASREATRLYREIIDRVSEFKYNIGKEELANKRLELIDNSGIQIYRVFPGEYDRFSYSKNRSAALFDSLANNEFKTETQEEED